MNQRRLLVTLLTLLLAAQSFGMAGCGNNDDNNTSNNTTVTDMAGGDMSADMSGADMPADMSTPVDMATPDMATPVDMATPDMATPDMSADLGADMEVDMFDPCSLDDDYDGVNNCDEVASGCMDPNNIDTDGDGLADLSELQTNTDPCDPDSDGDGLNDLDELKFGFDPNNPSTYGNGVTDDSLYIVTACDEPAAEAVIYKRSSSGDWKLALAPAFSNYRDLTIINPPAGSTGKEAIATYDDATNEVAGFVLSADKAAVGAPTAEQVALDYLNTLGSVSGFNIKQDIVEGEFDTHDGFKAAPGRYLIEVTTRSAKKMRDDILFALAPVGPADVTGLPNSSGAGYTEFRVFVTVLERHNRYITLVAIAPATQFDTRDQVKFRMSDLTNTTGVAQAGDGDSLRCHIFPVTIEVPQADFYWVLDQSGSMSDDFAKVQQFAGDFYLQLQNTALDFRLGVANMDADYGGKLRANVGWHRDVQTFKDEIQDYVIDCSPCDGATEHGLWSAQEGIRHMRRSSTPLLERIRPAASLATVIMSDERPQSVKDRRFPGGTTMTEDQILREFKNFFVGQTTMFTIVSPGGSCGEDGKDYTEVALATGGLNASLCAADLQESIVAIIETIAGRASGFRLPDYPISSTLRVYQGDPADPTQGRWVPRSRVSGFDYFPQTNSIAFFGDEYKPDPDSGAPVQVAVHYERFIDKTKTPPLRPNAP